MGCVTSGFGYALTFNSGMEYVKQAVLLLGSNLGDRLRHLADALALIGDVGTVRAQSAIYETAAWGREGEPPYLNQVVTLATALTPLELLDALQRIEQHLGRRPADRWAARIIDLDILFFGDTVVRTGRLEIPHPQIAWRRFTLVPLAELLPDFIHPSIGQTVRHLLAECADTLPVTRYAG